MVLARLRVRVFACASFLLSLLLLFAPTAEAQTSFGTVTQGSSKTLGVSVTIPATGSFSTIAVVTQGAAGLDFTNAGGGTCVAGSSYATGATCTVEVAFAPKHAGTRYGAVVLSTASGVVATTYLEGTGSGTLTQTTPGSVLQPFTSVAAVPEGIAVDGSGDVFFSVCNAGSSAIYKETPSTGGAYSQTTVGSGWVCPGALALDGAGNLYVFDEVVSSFNETLLYKLTLAGGAYAKSEILSGFVNASGLAVDGAGNLYINDTLTPLSTSAVYKETLAAGAYTQSSIGTGWGYVSGLAVDGAGNVYVANSSAGPIFAIVTETPNGNSYTQKTTALPSGIAQLGAMSIDGTGNLYVVDNEQNAGNPSNIYLESASNGSFRGTALGAGWAAPYALSVDGSGDVFVLDDDSAYEVYTGPTTPSTMTVTANPSSPVFGTSVLITATVSGTGTKTVPTGNVVFNDGQYDVATVALSSAGTASWTASGSTYGSQSDGGSYTFSASYAGSEQFGASSGHVAVTWSFPQCPITFSPAAGTYTGSVTVTVSASPCQIFGNNGGNPSQESIVVPSTETLSVTAGANGYDNTTATATYTIVPATTAGIIETLAGNGTSGYSGDAGAATSAKLSRPFGVATDSAGNTYIADTFNSRVRKVTPAGTITTYVGTGVFGSTGDGGPATSAELGYPQTLAFDSVGNMYIADPPTNRVRKVTPQGVISTYAGTGVAGHAGDGGAATSAQLSYPAGVAVDATGNLYIAEANSESIRKVTPSGTISTIAGNGVRGYAGDGGVATSAEFAQPGGLAVDAAGNVYVADQSNDRIRKITPAGTITTVAGNGTAGYSGDGGAATSAELNAPLGVAVDTAGNLYIADLSNSRVRKVTSAGTITTFAGTNTPGFSGDGGPAASAEVYDPFGVGVDSSGNVYIADTYNSRIREVLAGSTAVTAATPVISPVGGTYTSAQTVTMTDATAGATIYYTTNGSAPTASSTRYSAAFTVSASETIQAIAVASGYTNSAVATAAYTITPNATATPSFSVASGAYSAPQSVAITDATSGSTIYYTTNGTTPTSSSFVYGGPISVASTTTINAIAVASGFTSSAVATASYAISGVNGIISTVAGNGTAGFAGDGGAAASAEIDYPGGVAFDGSGNLYIADSRNSQIRKVTPAGTISTLAATSTLLNYPQGVAFDASGNLYIADELSQVVRKVTPTGVASIFAGNGSFGFGGDGGPATGASFSYPLAVAVDRLGNVYIADEGNNRIRKVTPAGVITTVAGNGTLAYAGDGGSAVSAELSSPHGVAVDSAGNLYIGDWGNNRIRMVNPAGVITTVAGNGTQGFGGDGGAATSAEIYYAGGVAVDRAGNLYFSDQDNERVRVVNPAGIISTVAGNGTAGFSGDGGLATAAEMQNPFGIAVDSSGNVYMADEYNNRVRKVTFGAQMAAAAPVFSPAGGIYTGSQTVTISDTTTGAAIYYTTNGTAPTAASTRYTGAITVSATETVEAIAVAPGYTNSLVSTASYTITPQTATPVFSVAGGAYSSQQTVTLTDATAGATIYYTTNGTAPTASSAIYTAPILVTTSETIEAFAVAAGSTNSAVATASYTFSYGVITTLAGNGTMGHSGDNGPAVSAELNFPSGVAVLSNASVYIADKSNNRIRVVTSVGGTGGLTALGGPISEVAGTGTAGFSGDGGADFNAEINGPQSVILDPVGGMYIADTFNNRVRKVSPGGTITTIAGTGVQGFSGDGGPATSAELSDPEGLAIDKLGNLYIAEYGNSRVRMVSPTGTITTFAGGGTTLGDGGLATKASLGNPYGVAADQAGNIYIADTFNQRIRKVNSSGVISTFAGTGTSGYGGDGGLATSASLSFPEGVTVDLNGNVFVADTFNNRIREINPAGLITTVAGNGIGGFSGDGGSPLQAEINQPTGISVDSHGFLYFPDYANQRVRIVTYSGIPPTAASPTFSLGSGTYSGALSVTLTDATAGATIYYTTNGTTPTASSSVYTGPITIPATPGLTEMIKAIAVAPNYSASAVSTATYSILPPAATPVISLASGTYSTTQTVTIADATPSATIYYTLNGSVPTNLSPIYTGPITVSASETIEAKASATGYSLSSPAIATYTIAPLVATPVFSPAAGSYASAQTITISDATAGATIFYSTNGTAPTTLSTQYTRPLTVAATETIEAFAVAPGDTNSAVAIAAYTITQPTTSGVISTVAGNGTRGSGGNGGAATSAELAAPDGVATDQAGNFYIADTYNSVVRKVTPAGVITVVAGNGTAGFSGDGGAALSAEINYPTGVVIDPAGDLYIADLNNNRIRKVSAAGTISTVAGNGTAGYAGDGGAATGAELHNPTGVALDANGNLYIADWNNNVVRKVTLAGTISTVAGNGTKGFTGDGGAATSAELNFPYGVAVDAAGDLFIADSTNFRVRKVTAAGIISTIAGTGMNSFSGDGGLASTAGLSYVNSVALDPSGDLFIADTGNNRIRVVSSNGTIATAAGTGAGGYAGDGGAAISAKLNGENGLAFDAYGNLLIADTQNSAIRKVTFGAAAMPAFSPSGGTYAAAQTVTITDATAGATIYYTTNGTAPTTSSTRYTGPIAVSASETVEAVAAGGGFSNSPVASAAYSIEGPAATPVLSLPTGTYSAALSVAITDATAGATIYYTTNGTTPTTSSSKYTGAIAIPATAGLTETLEAIAVAPGYNASTVITAVYTITPPAATPVISPASGTYTTAQSVTITDATPSATLYYTTNGSVPTTSSAKYTGPITVSASETIEAKAIATGYSLSSPAIAAYTITLTAAAPTFSVAAGTYESVQTVTLASATPGAVMYYTINGTAPSTASTQYTGPVTVAASETVEAIAVATGYVNSPVALASYTIVGSPTALAENATAITATTATLNALINLQGISGSYSFAYGTSSTSLTSTTASTPLSNPGTVPVSVPLTGLTPGMTYYFKVVVVTAGGSASGATLSFSAL